MAQIKGAGTHETEGIAAEGWFHTDEKAARGGWAYLYVLLPWPWTALSRLTWEFNLIALLMHFDYTANVTQSCTCNLCALSPGGVLYCLPKSNP